MLWLFSMLTGCLSGGGLLPQQGPVQAQLVVHVDPLIRGPVEPCENDALVQCGSLKGESFVRRTNNLAWLAQHWLSGQRTMDIQVGPDAALAWSQDSEVLSDLAEDVGPDVALDTAERGWLLLHQIISVGAGTLGVHGHDQVRDAGGLWGDVLSLEQPEPCLGVEDGLLTEWVLAEHVEGVATLADSLDVPLLSLSSHVPRTMANKILAATEPNSIDPNTDHVFSDRFRPVSLGNAMSSCFSQVADHPPFETFMASPEGPLVAGEGPMVVPAVRVVGSMAPHFGMERDGSLPAAHRRLIQLLLNWRYAALESPAERPWTYTFHAHLFDLQEGQPGLFTPDDRQLDPANGQSFRQELEEMGRLIDALTERAEWNGVMASEGGVAEWRTIDQFEVEGSAFHYDDALSSGSDPTDSHPYLGLLSEQLKHAHYSCESRIGSVQLYGFERCDAGWGWGMPGYGCADGSASDWVGVLVPEMDGCVDVEPAGLLVAPLDGEALSPPELCNDGIWVPRQGMVVATSPAATLPALCAAG